MVKLSLILTHAQPSGWHVVPKPQTPPLSLCASVSLCHCWHALVIVVLVLVVFYSSDLSGHAPVPVLYPAASAFDETLGFMLVT